MFYDVMYGDGQGIISSLLTTDLLSMLSEDYLQELDIDEPKNIDAECSLGKGLFSNLIRKANPPTLKFNDDGTLDLLVGLGCAITVEEEEENYKPFRAIYIELKAKAKIEVKDDPKTNFMDIDAGMKDLQVSKLKIFKGEEEMVAEQTTIQIMLSTMMTLGQSLINQSIENEIAADPDRDPCLGLKSEGFHF